ncbi:hypothetical protein BHM03_00057996 [Ensete ventricosum]|nr:hypothetical protein BHM03_00057996 [Ensete ventricosum]
MAVASPLCTWLVAVGCASSIAACDHDLPGSRRRRMAAIPPGGRDSTTRRLISPPCGFRIRGLVSSCLAFDPCADVRGSASPEGNRRRLSPPAASGSVHSSKPRPAMPVSLETAKEVGVKKKRHMKQRRVVVTGMGVVTPLGHDLDTFYTNLLEGEIKSFSTDGWVAPKLSRRMDKFMLYLLTAGKKALEDGGVTEEVMSQFEKTRCGVLIGSAMGGMKDRDGFVMAEGAGVLLLEELDHAKLRVNSTKSMTGHLLGAAGAVEAVAVVQVMILLAVDVGMLVGSGKERLDVKVALSNSFGFGGQNSSILLAPYK